MASETIYGYFGKKGAGKSHELVRIICERLKEGRRVVAVFPQLNVQRVAQYLGDPTVLDRLTVVDYADVLKPGFWPDEDTIREIQLWQRYDLDQGEKSEDGEWLRLPEEATPETKRNPLPEKAARWKESVVIPGSIVVIDEAWRWLKSEKAIPDSFRAALHMARHWHGPIDWRDPEMVRRYEDPEWFPGLGGPESVETRLDKGGTETRYKGGDGTPLVTTNILFASQDFFGLAKSLRGQIDQTTQLVAINDDFFPMFMKDLKDGKEQYKSYTFESADMPTRTQLLSMLDKKKDKTWIGEATLTHSDEMHQLYEYSSGYAKEVRPDDKAALKNNPAMRKMKMQLMLVVGVVGAGIGLAVYGANYMEGASVKPGQAPGVGQAISAPQQGGVSSAVSATSRGVSRSEETSIEKAPYGIAGKVGEVIAIASGHDYAYTGTGSMTMVGPGRFSVKMEGRVLDSGYDIAQEDGDRGARGSGDTGGMDDAGKGKNQGPVDAARLRELAKAGNAEAAAQRGGAGQTIGNPFGPS